MNRVLPILLGCLLLTASGLLARGVEETYQAALMEEKGEGRLEEAIRLYRKVVEAHEKGEGTDSLAARAKLRVGVCQEKLGLARARETYEAVIEEYPEEPQAKMEAARNLRSARRREDTLEERTSVIAVDDSLAIPRAFQEFKDLLEQAAQDGEPVAGHEFQEFENLQEQTADTSGSASGRFLYFKVDSLLRQRLGPLPEEIRSQIRVLEPSSRISSDQRYHQYANTPAVVPYSYEEVAEVPLYWKFRPEVDGPHPQRHAYSAPEFDDTDWSTISIGRAWEDQGYAGYDTGAWYRTSITVSADSVRPVLMAFGGVDKDAFVYVNGRPAGQHHVWNLPFILDISDYVVRNGENVIALYVYDGRLMGGVYGLINVHQPTEEIETADFAANRGGRLHLVYREADWPEFIAAWGYEEYANRPPRVPYPHQMVAEVPMEWKFRLDVGAMNPQRRRQYADPDYDDSQWTGISIGQAWEGQGYRYDEGAWYRTRFEVDAEEGRPVHLAFGGVDKDAYVYVNGELVGQHHERKRPFIFDISSQVVRDGENTVALYVYDGGGMGGVYGLVQVLQPTGDENLDRYLTNRGGSVKRSFWSRIF